MGDKQSTPTFKQTLHKKRSLDLDPQPLGKSRRQNYWKIQADKQMEKESAKTEMNDSPTSPEPIIQSSPSSSPEWDQSFYSPTNVNPRFSKQPLSNSSSGSNQKTIVDSYPPSPQNSPTHIASSTSNSISKRSTLKRSSEEVQEEEPSLDFFLDTLHGSLDPFNEPESNNNNNNVNSFSNSNNTNNTYSEDTEEEATIEPQKPSPSEEQSSQPIRFNSFRLTPPKKVVAPPMIDLRTPSPAPKRDNANRFGTLSDEPAVSMPTRALLNQQQYTVPDAWDDMEWPEEEPANRSNKTIEDVPANQHRSRLRQSKLTKPPRTDTQSESNNKKKEIPNSNTHANQPYQTSRWRDDLPQPPANHRAYSSFRDILPYAELNRSTSRQNAFSQTSAEPPSYSQMPSFEPQTTPFMSEPSEQSFSTDEELARHLQLIEQYGPNAERMISQQTHRRHGTTLGTTGARNAPRPSQDEEIARRMQEMEYNRGFIAPSFRGYDPMGVVQMFARRRFAPSSSHSAHAPLHMRLAMTNRDFTDEDYEMLLQLDEQVEKKGASKSTILSLPTRKIRDGEIIEKCVICLSEMEPETEVRLLPCAHFFHHECIDEWLKHNKCCPIDKKDVTQHH